jgi:hypothetical protein
LPEKQCRNDRQLGSFFRPTLHSFHKTLANKHVSSQRVWNLVIAQCVIALEDTEIRLRNALETLYLLLAGILHHRFSNWAIDVTTILVGKESNVIGPFFKRLLEKLSNLLTTDHEEVRCLSLHVLLTLITANNSMEDNFMIQYILEAGMAPILSDLFLSQPSGVTRRDCLALITLLSISQEIHVGKYSNLSKNEGLGLETTSSLNAYAQLLRACEAGPFLKHTISLLEHDMRVALRHRGGVPYEDQKASSSSLASMLGDWIRLYTSTHEPSFIDSVELQNARLSPSECFLSNPGLSFLVFHLLVQHNEFFMKSLFFPATLDMSNPIPTGITSRKLPSAIIPSILIDFLELSSFYLPSTEPKGLVYARLFLTTMLIIVENTELCFLLHDDKLSTNIEFKGDKRKTERSDRILPSTTGLPLATFIIETCHMFLRYHISADLLGGGELAWICEIYSTCLNILHRLICFEKKVHIRLTYPWKGLWSTLMMFLTNFCASILAKTSITPHSLTTDVLPIIKKVFVIFNIGITFGDHFLPTPTNYDELYYEIIRCERQFRSIINSAEEIEARSREVEVTEQTEQIEQVEDAKDAKDAKEADSSNGLASPPSPSTAPSPPSSLAAGMFNIVSILDHFSEKLGHFQVVNPETPVSGPLVINMIKSNYENLRLKLQDDIDQFERYDGTNIAEQKMLRRYAKVLVQDLKLKRYTEIESAISQRLATKLLPSSSSS